MLNVPAVRVVPAAYVLTPERVNVPVPIFVKDPEPLITPGVKRLMVNPCVSKMEFPVRVNERTEENGGTPAAACNVAEPITMVFEALPKEPSPAALSVPPEIVKVPEKVLVVEFKVNFCVPLKAIPPPLPPPRP